MIKTKTAAGNAVELTRKEYNIWAKVVTGTKLGTLSFPIKGWHECDGQEGIHGQAYIGKKQTCVTLTIPEKVWLDAKKAADADLAADTEKAMALKAIGFSYEMGCDAGNRYAFVYEDHDLPWKAFNARLDADRSIIDEISKLDLRQLADSMETTSIEATGSTYGGWLFHDVGALIDAATEAQAEVAEAKAERDRQRDALETSKIKDAIKAAIIAGRPVKYGQWSEDCNGSEDECSTDIIMQYIDGDGHFTYKRTHCH